MQKKILMTRRQIVTELKKIGWKLKRKFWNPPNKRDYKGISKKIKETGMVGLPLRAAAAIEEMISNDVLE